MIGAIMMYYLFKYLPILLLGAPVAFWGYLNLRTGRQARILLIAGALAGGAIVALVAAGAIAQIPHDQWSASRLAPAIAWARGCRLYDGSGEGPALVRMYGPVPWILYAPTAFITTPTFAVLAAAAVNLLCFVVPVVWLVWTCCRECSRVERLAGLALFSVIAVFSRPLFDSAFAVSIDGPAIGFAAATCAVVIGARDIPSLRVAILAGLFASLSVWSKQTMWPFVLAPVSYLFLTQRPGAAARFTAAFVSVIISISFALLLTFGWREMLFNMYTIPSRHPWQWGWMRATKLIARECLWPAALLAAALALRGRRWERNCWILPALCAVFVVPTTASAYAKVPGRANNAAPEVYMLLLAGAIALIRLLRVESETLPRKQRLAMLFAACIFIAIPIVHRNDLKRLPDQLAGWSRLRENDNDQPFRVARERPGTIYFPQQPLASLFAEGRAYHSEAAVADLHLAGMRLSAAQLAAELPDDMRAVAYKGSTGGLMLEYLPEFEHQTTIPGLPGWTLFERREH